MYEKLSAYPECMDSEAKPLAFVSQHVTLLFIAAFKSLNIYDF